MTKAKEKKPEEKKQIHITPPNLKILACTIEGKEQYVQHKFSAKSRLAMMQAQQEGSKGKKGKKREARNFKQDCKEATHFSDKKWIGIPAAAFRNAMIDACRLVGFKMTHSKMGVSIVSDGSDADDGTPLVKITRGKPTRREMHVRLETGVASVVSRPHWKPGWRAVIKVEYDADMFDETDIVNLLDRAGQQVGVGEGRPFSKKSAGMGWGTFKVISDGK